MASKAANVPASGCTTMLGSPDLGSWKVVEPPTGTALADATRTPAGFATGVVVGADVDPDPAPVVALVDGDDVGVPVTPEPGPDLPPSRPSPAARPALANATAANPPAKTPCNVKVLRSMSPVTGAGVVVGAWRR